MNRTEARKAITRRNKARKNLKRYKDILWKCKFSSPDYKRYQRRLKDAEQELKDSNAGFMEALRVVL